MLVVRRLFLWEFFSRFFLFYLCLVPLFLSCDFIVRLAVAPFSIRLFKLFLFMVPMVSVFAVPIAASMSVGVVVGGTISRNEILMLRFFPSAKKSLELSLFLFAIVIASIYIPLVFNWAPNSYWKGKSFLVRTIQTHIENLSPKKFHPVASKCTIFFKSKNKNWGGNVSSTRFDDILLMMRDKDEKKYLVTARYGILQNGVLELFLGTIYNEDNGTNGTKCIASFKSLEISFERMFFDKKNNLNRSKKFMTTRELLNEYYNNSNDDAWREFNKRLIQIIWQIFLPFLVMFSMIIFGRQKSNILLSVVISAFLFLFSYLSINMAYFFLQKSLVYIVLFYSVPLVLFFFLCCKYRVKIT